MTPTAAALSRIPLFGSLSESELDDLALSFESRSVGAGTRLTGERAQGYSFFVLAEGQAAVTIGETKVSALDPGDCFGEMALLGDGRRTATVTTTTPATLFVMFGTEFRRLQQGHPEIAARLESLMRTRLVRDS